MAILIPFFGVPGRIVWLRVILLSACFFGMAASVPLWLNTRHYPLLPIASWFPLLPAPWDKWFFGALLLSLVLACWFYRYAVIFFLIGSSFLALGDQNRLQPWFYLYWVMLLLTLLPEAPALAACRLAVTAVYFWSGVQKCAPEFFRLVVPPFIKPAANWLPPSLMPLVYWMMAAAPAVEIFIALGLWIAACRKAAVVAAVCLHLIILIFLGPLGHKFNLVVWPWNLAMPLLILALFPFGGIRPAWVDLRRSSLALVMAVLVCGLPVLSFFGWWYSYLSFALYSGNVAKADLFVSAALKERLPAFMQPFIHATAQEFNPAFQGPFVVDYQTWAEKELGVPPLPEPAGYVAVARYVARFASDPNAIHLLVAPRFGQVRFYSGAMLK